MTTTKSPDFWLRDGSIVLSVEKTLFRVHQTILANHSEIFSDLFTLPQPPSDPGGQDIIEGCLVVELQDKAKDVLDLLKAIYHPAHFDQLSATADLDVLLNFIGGILRLSTKYVIHELRKRCIALLASRFPTTYVDYLDSAPRPYIPSPSPASNGSAVQDDSSLNWSSITTFSLVASNSPPSDGSATTSYHIQPQLAHHHHQTSRSRRHSDHVHNRDRDYYRLKTLKEEQPPKPKLSSIMRAIALANETNVTTILPYAYYLLARTSEPQRLLSHSSGSLSWHQKAILLVGRSHLHNAEISISHAFLASFVAAPTCISPSTCSSFRGPQTEWALLCAKGRGGPEPLRPWDRWDRLGVCQVCVAHAMRWHERGRAEVWERLPGYFELGTWSELKARQAA